MLCTITMIIHRHFHYYYNLHCQCRWHYEDIALTMITISEYIRTEIHTCIFSCTDLHSYLQTYRSTPLLALLNLLAPLALHCSPCLPGCWARLPRLPCLPCLQCLLRVFCRLPRWPCVVYRLPLTVVFLVRLAVRRLARRVALFAPLALRASPRLPCSLAGRASSACCGCMFAACAACPGLPCLPCLALRCPARVVLAFLAVRASLAFADNAELSILLGPFLSTRLFSLVGRAPAQ